MKNYELSPPADWVKLYGDHLFHYAFVRFRNHEIAEELVQETFLAALRSKDSFSGLSSEKTWLFAILKHKIIDIYRKREKESILITTDDFANLYFDEKGFWKKEIPEWKNDPKDLVEQKEFWEVFEKCLQHLPEDMEKVFKLKMLEKFASEEICDILQISLSNLWVRLHRARTKMRECLEKCWFLQEPE